MEAIGNSQHFIYIENQFFITATGEEQAPIKNKIGGAIVERILRAAKAGEKYKVIVAMPSVPALFVLFIQPDQGLETNRPIVPGIFMQKAVWERLLS